MPRPKSLLTCSRDNCDREHHAKGLCANHYRSYQAKLRRHENKQIIEKFDYRNIDYNDYWEFVKKELKING